MKYQSIVLFFWALVLLVIATSKPSTPFVLLEPGSFDFIVILSFFLITSTYPIPGFGIILLNLAAGAKLNHEKHKEAGLIDYGDVIGRNNPGGFLQAGLNTEWLGERAHSRIVTDRFGFRTTQNIQQSKPSNVFRIIFI